LVAAWLLLNSNKSRAPRPSEYHAYRLSLVSYRHEE